MTLPVTWQRSLLFSNGSAQARLSTPSWLTKYKVLRFIDAGGMGDVYKGEQLKPERRDVAIKLIKGRNGQQGDSRAF